MFFAGVFAVEANASSWRDTNLIGAMKDYNPALTDDFYANVNHEWLVNAKLKPGRSSNASFYELQDIVDANLKAIMTDDTLTGHDAELVRKLYSLWLDWDARNKNGLADLPEQAKLITDIKTLDDLTKYFMSESSFYHGTVIADFVLGVDNKNSEAYNLELSATGLSLGDSAEYKELTPNGERTKKMHRAIVSYMLGRFGYSDEEISAHLAREFEFEKKLAPFMMTHEEIYAPEAIERMYNPLTLDELREKSPVFPFADIIASHKAQSRYMNLQEPEWLKVLNDTYTPENLELMKSYLLCRIAAGYMGVIDEAAYRELQRISRERYGIKESKPDDELAVDFVHGSLPVPVSRLYVARYVPESAKREVTGIIRETVKYYRSMLAGEEWLSQSTREKAVEKLDAMRLNAAYPDKWTDFSGLNIPDDFYGAVQAIHKYKTQKYFYDRLNTNVDHDLWINDVVVVNSYYRPSENSINIIAGILGGDFYRPEMSYEEKLGGIGSVIGHEISHAFDTNGAQFDKSGNVLSWWTDDDYREFKARADKLIKYLDTFGVNGSLIQTETIADMAGVKAMLGIAAERENFDYDKFFRSYARTWKLIQTQESLDMVLKVDVHALPYLRVNAIVQQYGKFYETYGITSGDNMYLGERVAVW